MERISSMMMTVLPTPAPPKMPVLPPLVKGRDQVDHLDAGLKDLDFGRPALRNGGAGRWIGIACALVSTRPALSTGGPSTLKMRPSVAGPTGT